MKPKRPLWACPKCGARFVNRNQWHSCVRVRPEDHLAKATPQVRELFKAFETIVRACGPVRRVSVLGHIGFMGRVRFAGAQFRKDYIRVGLWLRRRATHRTLDNVEVILGRDFIHRFKIRARRDMDAAFRKLVREAYAIGQQAHLEGRRTSRTQISH